MSLTQSHSKKKKKKIKCHIEGNTCESQGQGSGQVLKREAQEGKIFGLLS